MNHLEAIRTQAHDKLQQLYQEAQSARLLSQAPNQTLRNLAKQLRRWAKPKARTPHQASPIQEV